MYLIAAHAQSAKLLLLKTSKPLVIGVLPGTRAKLSRTGSFARSRSIRPVNIENFHSLSICENVKRIWSKPTKGHMKVVSLSLFALCCIAFPQPVYAASVQDLAPMVESWVALAGPLGPVVFILLYGLAAVLLIPASVLTISAGFLFGPLMGTIIVSIASTFGAGLSFLIGRYAARSFIERRIGENEKFAAIDKALAKQGAKGASSSNNAFYNFDDNFVSYDCSGLSDALVSNISLLIDKLFAGALKGAIF